MMQEFLPNTDNFFKYLLTIGLILIIFTIIYPVQMQKEIDMELLGYKSKVEILSLEISHIEKEVEKLNTLRLDIQKDMDSLKEVKNSVSGKRIVTIENIRIALKEKFDNNKENILIKVDSLKIKQIILSSEKERINKLNGYYSFFKVNKSFLLGIGFILCFLGFRYWISSVYVDELQKGKKIYANYKSSFIRHANYCKIKFIRNWTIVLFILVALFLFYTIMTTV